VKIRIKYLKAWVDRKTGIAYARLRRNGQPEITLPTPVGSPEFWAGYHAALRGEHPVPIVAAVRHNTIAAAVARYIEEALPKRVNGVTLSRQSATLRKFAAIESVGSLPVKVLDRKYIDRNIAEADTIGIANTWLITMRPFCQWAVTQELLAVDPTAGIVLKLPKSEGHATWTEEQIAQFEARWPLGTRERLLFALLLCTGQRCSDVRKLGPHSIVKGAFPITQQKTGAKVLVPVLPELAAAIAACNVVGIHSDTFLGTKRGVLIMQRDLNKWFRKACDEAGLPTTCVPHGLRKACCRRLAQAGCSVKLIQAISGHLTLKEIERYTRDFDNEQGARDAFAKLAAARAA
jgi:integrase